MRVLAPEIELYRTLSLSAGICADEADIKSR